MSGADDEFAARRAALSRRVGEIEARSGNRANFFDGVYDMAGDDPSAVPWADLKPKAELVGWLAGNPGRGGRAIDVACGLGDNAEAIAAAGYRTVAFDGSEKAIRWARERFPESDVDYRVADLLDVPAEWRSTFDLVNECYTIQSVPPDRHAAFAAAIAGLVKPGGTLLVYMRRRDEGSEASGPPWPLMPSELEIFSTMGFERVAHRPFALNRPDRTIPIVFDVWRRNGAEVA